MRNINKAIQINLLVFDPSVRTREWQERSTNKRVERAHHTGNAPLLSGARRVTPAARPFTLLPLLACQALSYGATKAA